MEEDVIKRDSAHSETKDNSSSDIPTENIPEQQEKISVRRRSPLMRVLHFFIVFILSVIYTAVLASGLVLFVIYGAPYLQQKEGEKNQVTEKQEISSQNMNVKKQVSLITKDIQKFSAKINGYTSNQSYIIINTTDNRFFLYTNKKLVREGFCSSGSYTLLQSATGNKQWIFKTPKGKYWIHGKTTKPVWYRPDWSFVEEGSPIPPKDDQSRFENGVLGDYALALGDGYLIHGTIYKRFLGMPVTHGCVRLNDEDLKVVFNTLDMGSKVYIF